VLRCFALLLDAKMLGFSLLCLDDDERPESGEGAWISILNDTTPVHH